MKSTVTILVIAGIVGSTVLTLVIVFLVMRFARKMTGQAFGTDERTVRLLETGEPATARILSIAQTGTSVAVWGVQRIQFSMVLEVHPSAGAPYQVQVSHYVGLAELASFQPGATIPVTIDRSDPQNVVVGSRRTVGQPLVTG